MKELIVNLHMHTRYSDGHGSHSDIVAAGLKTGIDVAIVSDHNVWVNGPQDFYTEGDRRLLLLIGEEIHDQARDPQKNHLLVFGADRELATYAFDPQTLIEQVQRVGGLSFLAHPDDKAAPVIRETSIAWLDWNLQGYTGIELWNTMSELKNYFHSYLHAVFYILFPHRIARGPDRDTLAKWDGLLKSGRRLVAIGGSDAHQFPVRVGPFRRAIFPYELHFGWLNTHLLVKTDLSADPAEAAAQVYEALRSGRAFIGYDWPAPTRGFHFVGHGKEQIAEMGDTISCKFGVTLQIKLPRRTECCLIKDGQLLKTWQDRDICTYTATAPGAYRVEAYLQTFGARRGWIYSNPIYITV
jgi:hypothetical protein